MHSYLYVLIMILKIILLVCWHVMLIHKASLQPSGIFFHSPPRLCEIFFCISLQLLPQSIWIFLNMKVCLLSRPNLTYKYFLWQKIRDYSLYEYYHHHVVLVVWISLTLSRHFSLSFIASGRSYGQHPVSSHSC